MNKQKITALILVSLIAAQTLTACGGGETQTDDTTPAVTTPAETTWEVHDDLGDLRFDGEEFVMWLGVPYPQFEMEEQTGEVLDDAVYARNRGVEERLGITLTYNMFGTGWGGTDQANSTSQITSNVLAGDSENDVYLHVQHGGMPGLIADGLFVDYNTIPNIDMTKDYWYSNCIRDINYGTKIYNMTGAYSLNVLTEANILGFNKRILEEAQIEFPYQMVLDGTWTIDKFYKMVETVTQDINGDTNLTPDADIIGYNGWIYEMMYAMFMGMGGDHVTKDKDNIPIDNANTERHVEIVDKMISLFQLDGAMYEGSTSSIVYNGFTSGKLAFLHADLNRLTGFRDMEDDFGFVPYPKLDESQDSYHVRIQNTAPMTYVPVTNADLAFTGAVLEVMSSYSYHYVVPAFFDNVLTVKTARDTESEQMVPIILDSCSFFDSAVTFDIQGMVKNQRALTTWYASAQGTIENQLQTIIDTYS